MTITNDTLIWLLPAMGSILGVSFMIGRQVSALAQNKASVQAIHRRLDEFRTQLVELERTIEEVREILISRGYIEVGTNPGVR